MVSDRVSQFGASICWERAMSIEGFVRHGYHRGLVMTRHDSEIYGPIELYDIGITGLIGARYDDNSRQVHPIAWHQRFGIQKALAKHVPPKPRIERLRAPEHAHETQSTASSRPRLVRKDETVQPSKTTAKPRLHRG